MAKFHFTWIATVKGSFDTEEEAILFLDELELDNSEHDLYLELGEVEIYEGNRLIEIPDGFEDFYFMGLDEASKPIMKSYKEVFGRKRIP